MKTYGRLMALAWFVVVLLQGGEACAQAPATPPPRKIYTRDRHFRLPIGLEDKDRANLQEIQLYVKNGPGEPWTLKERVLGTAKWFEYRVGHDAEYWFATATVTKTGKMIPADISQLSPGLIVIVDTKPPEIAIRVLPPSPRGVLVECTVRDANWDRSGVRVEYQGTDKTWQFLEPLADEPGVYRLPGSAMPEGVLRATAIDRAGNVSTRTIDLASASIAVAPPAPAGTVVQAVAVESRPEKATVSPVAHTVESRSDKASVPAPVPPVAAGRQLVSGTHVSLEYQVEQQGPSGVSKVEVWMTRDEGATWQRLCEDPAHRSPVEFDLPGEGVFGITLVVTNGSGFGGTPPVKGDPPDYWIEVDMTKPVAQLLAVRPGVGDNAGTLLISWLASDKNLGPDPIDLYYAPHRDGPWRAIGRGIKNEGSYRWTPPRDAGSEFLIRLDVTDRAGNLMRCESPQPVVLDLSRPRARVLGVTVSARPSAPPAKQ